MSDLCNKDFNLCYNWKQDGDVLYLDHLWLDPSLRGERHGSFIIETIVRIAYYEGARVVEVSIGGGGTSETFLKRNGFRIIRRRPYDEEWRDDVEGDYGVDAVRPVKQKTY